MAPFLKQKLLFPHMINEVLRGKRCHLGKFWNEISSFESTDNLYALVTQRDQEDNIIHV